MSVEVCSLECFKWLVEVIKEVAGGWSWKSSTEKFSFHECFDSSIIEAGIFHRGKCLHFKPRNQILSIQFN